MMLRIETAEVKETSTSPSITSNKPFVVPATPSHVLDATPTPGGNLRSILPYDTPEPSAKATFQNLSKQQIDFDNGFPSIEPVKGSATSVTNGHVSKKSSQMEIIAESVVDAHDDDAKEDMEDSIVNASKGLQLNALKINVDPEPTPKQPNGMNGHKRRRSSKTFKLKDNELVEEKTTTTTTTKQTTATSKPAKQVSEAETLLEHGYEKKKFVANTLQGHVILAKRTDKDGMVVIKTSKQALYNKRVTTAKNGKQYKVQEDIKKEAKLMEQFMAAQHPSSLIEYYDFFEDAEQLYLVMEDGGTDLFDFVVKCHEQIANSKLSIREWRKHVKFMFAQMVLFIGWMHQVQHCCNLDVSLENMLICKEAKVHESDDEFKANKCYVKFIDFGLSELFDPVLNPCFLCNKFVGKQRYKAPEVFTPSGTFCANKADIWSLGVCLFMMCIGSPPFDKPVESDIAYRYVQAGRISDLCQSWNRLNYLTSNLLDLLKRMLCPNPAKRISIEEIMKHSWVKIYFPVNNPATPDE